MSAAEAAAAAGTTAAVEATAEVVETIVDNSAQILTYVAILVGGALAVGWAVRRFGEASMDAAADRGLLDPPTWAVAQPGIDDPDDEPDDDDQDQAYAETGDGQWAR